jgi:hypothetical protein
VFNTPFTTHAVRTFASILVTLTLAACGTVPAASTADQVVESLQHNKGAL